MGNINKGTRLRTFEFMLYPDTTDYDCESLMHEIQSYFKSWAYCLHDKDVNEKGELIKAHLHVVGYKENASSTSAVIKHFNKVGFDIGRWIQPWSSHRSAIRYLRHADDKNKYQYELEEVITNDDTIYSFYKTDNEGTLVEELVDMRLAGATYRELLRYASKQGAYDVFRRNLGIINIIVTEEVYDKRRDIVPCDFGDRFED